MSDLYYSDTKKAVEEVSDINLDLMNTHYSGKIDLLVTEVEGLLEQYAEKINEIDRLTELLDESGIAH